jgi:hypothetical protein
VKEGEYGADTVYSCMQMEKLYLLKLFQDWEKRRIKENGGGGEFTYDIFDIV